MNQDAIDRKSFVPVRDLPTVDNVRAQVTRDLVHAQAALWQSGLTDEVGNWIRQPNIERAKSCV